MSPLHHLTYLTRGISNVDNLISDAIDSRQIISRSHMNFINIATDVLRLLTTLYSTPQLLPEKRIIIKRF